MKKRILYAMLCAAVMLAFTGCGAKGAENDVQKEEALEEEAPEKVQVDAADAEDLLKKVWNAFDEDKKFPIGGGDYDHPTSDVPGKFDTAKAEDMDSMLGFPAGDAAKLTDAASIVHMMNANTFTAGAYHLADAEDAKELAEKLKEHIKERQWICGFPDKLIVASIGDEYLVSAFGIEENIAAFKEKLQEKYEMTEILYEENLE